MTKYLSIPILIICTITGQWFYTAPVLGLWMAATICLGAWMVYRRAQIPTITRLLGLVWLTGALSALVNDSWRVSLPILMIWLLPLLVTISAGSSDIEPALLWAGRGWVIIAPVLWLVFSENTNIIAAVTIALIAPLIIRHKFMIYAPLLALLGIMGARAGLIAGLIILIWWGLPFYWARMLKAGLPISGFYLFALAPHSALNRFGYWADGLRAWWSSPWVGIGVGNYLSRAVSVEPGTLLPQLHAHNLGVQMLVEMGVIGLLAVVPVGVYVYRHWGDYADWQRATMIGLLVMGVVDMPLWWAAVLVIAAVAIAQQSAIMMHSGD